MSEISSAQVVESYTVSGADLLECLRKIGKGLISAGTSAGVVENTLAEIAMIYEVECDIVALPNLILIDLGGSGKGQVDLTVQRLTSIQLDQISEMGELVERVRQKEITPAQASQQMDQILVKEPRFNSLLIVLGYVISCIGLTMLYRPEPRAMLITGTTGILVGLMVLWSKKLPRFNLLLPVFAAIVVSTLIFSLTRFDFIFGPANLLITPLIIFLPGALLTTGMIELASMHILSGSARLTYGATLLLLLFIGISIGLYFSGLSDKEVYAYEAVYFPWWAPVLGTTLFGVGTFIRMSGANRDLLWILVVLYIAMLGQAFGEGFLNSYFGAFLGATLMALSSEIIARSPRRTSALVSQMLAFWFLVPGARGLLSVTRLLSQDIQSAALGIGEMVILIISIALGVLLGTLVISPHKFVPISTDIQSLHMRYAK